MLRLAFSQLVNPPKIQYRDVAQISGYRFAQVTTPHITRIMLLIELALDIHWAILLLPPTALGA